jgi:hypothetical protein
MKKFILLFTIVAIGFTSAQAQQGISKILGKVSLNATGPYFDLEKDTMKNVTAYDKLSFHFAIEYTNGNTPLEAGDTIVFDVYISGMSNGSSITLGDSVHYVLKADLGAGDKIQMEDQSLCFFPVFNNYPNAHVTIEDVTTFPVWAKVYYTSKFVVNSQKMVTATFLKTKSNVSLNESSIEKVKLFPNPVNSNLNITNLNNTKVEIFNLVGQRILSHENVSGDLHVDMSAYSNGIYFVKMQNEKSTRTEKIKLVK